jgi:hypothetical protein
VIPDGSDGNYIYTKKLMMMKIWIDNVNWEDELALSWGEYAPVLWFSTFR